MRPEQTIITPEQAGDWLAKNSRNRRMSDSWVKELSRRILAGEWVLNGEAVILDTNGQLLDGQHRLAAIVMAGRPVESVVVYDAAPGSYRTIDTGKKRVFADVLYIAREDNYSRLSAIVKWQYRLDHGLLHRHISQPSHAELWDTLQAHPELKEANERGAEVEPLFRLMPPSLAVWIVHILRGVDEAKAESFVDGLARGIDLKPGPILALRERLMTNRLGKAKLTQEHICALAIKAFNAHLYDEELLTLLWRSNELFPVLAQRTAAIKYRRRVSSERREVARVSTVTVTAGGVQVV